LSGELEGQDDFFAEIGFLSLVAVLTMFALLTIAFRSYFLPILILSALPFGFCGAIIGHVIFGKGLSMISYWGIGAACGVVINDNLVLVDYINRIRKGGKHVLESIIEAGVVRFRPIIITSLTTFIGLMPIMLEPSVQANFLKPAVISLSFGVVLCAPVTLILVPCLMLIGEDIKQNLNNAKEAIKIRINKEITPV
jgi:multidrug efflux pump subunit AcrB